MISSVFKLPICSGHTGRSLAQGPAPKAKTRFLEQGPKLALGEESGKQSGDVPPGRRTSPKRCLRRGGCQTEGTLPRNTLVGGSNGNADAARAELERRLLARTEPSRNRPESVTCLTNVDEAVQPGTNAPVLVVGWLAAVSRQKRHRIWGFGVMILHSNAWSVRKWTMVNPRGLTVSSSFFTLSRKI